MDFELDIPEKVFKKDFIIIYKGLKEHEGHMIQSIEEIETCKEELIRKLRYFQQKTNEMKQMNEIFIHDIYPTKIFKDFIDSIETNKIQVNESNYMIYSELCSKYEYDSLQTVLDKFSSNRPDIQQILTEKTIDSIKEEKLSKNLDLCLQNENFAKLQISVLIRILNSPKRILHDHHLLFEFVKKIINQYEEHQIYSNSNDNDLEEDIQLLLSCLDFAEMTNEDLDELFQMKYLTGVFNCRHSKEKMKLLFEENKSKEKYQLELEKRILRIEEKLSTEMKSKDEEMNQLRADVERFQAKINQQEQDISRYQSENEQLRQLIDKQENKMREIEDKFNTIQNKLEEQENASKCQSEIEQLRKAHEDQSRRLSFFEKLFHLEVKITASVDSSQVIKGRIDIDERHTKLDKNKSKYILNTKSYAKLDMSEYEDGEQIKSSSHEFSFMKTAGTYFLHALIIDDIGNVDEYVSKAIQTKGIKYTFDYTGRVQSIKLNEGKYKLEVWGAEGGNNGAFSGFAGKGGYSVGLLTLKSETTLYVYVGGTTNSISGGWNGGGKSFSSVGGGGATDISLYGDEGSTDWNTENHFYSRIIVAGGGGGSSSSNNPDVFGGCGGGESGGTHDISMVEPGTQTAGNQFGVGGDGFLAAGCGGGWYGGHGYRGLASFKGGGGGSGYVYNSSTASSYPDNCKLNNSFYLSEAKTIPGDQDMPDTHGTANEKGHSGNGFASITPQ